MAGVRCSAALGGPSPRSTSPSYAGPDPPAGRRDLQRPTEQCDRTPQEGGPESGGAGASRMRPAAQAVVGPLDADAPLGISSYRRGT